VIAAPKATTRTAPGDFLQANKLHKTSQPLIHGFAPDSDPLCATVVRIVTASSAAHHRFAEKLRRSKSSALESQAVE
jgi:hypothetical protein